MYQVGDRVVYGIHGVCTIVEEERRIVDRKRVTFLVLVPAGQSGTRYLVPTHNANAMSKLSRLLTPEELVALLESEQLRREAWVPDESQRKQLYRELISGGSREKILQMLYSIYRHKERQQAAGKKCHMCDENFLRDGEKLISGEIAAVLQQEPQQARAYLRQKLQADAAGKQ